MRAAAAISLTLALALLSACGPRVAPVVTICTPVKAYTVQEQKALAAEVAALPTGAALLQAILDYQRMRDAGRACTAAAAKP